MRLVNTKRGTLLREAVWDHTGLIGQVAARVAADLAEGEEGVLIVDETAMLKQARHLGLMVSDSGVSLRVVYGALVR
jgi:hypothetical protein